jgi:hypothetical protein
LTWPVYPWIESAKSARSATWTHMVMSLSCVAWSIAGGYLTVQGFIWMVHYVEFAKRS